MSEAALFIRWGMPIPGREKQALEVFIESMQHWRHLEQEGRIERFDVAVLAEIGGDLGGFIMARGTTEQIESVRRSGDYQRLINCVQLIADGLRITNAFVDEGLAQLINRYEVGFGELD
jgi:hypothetical protein